MTDPRRLLDAGSEASPALRALLASARRHDDPRASQIEALSARLAASVEPPARSASTTPAPHTTAVARAHRKNQRLGRSIPTGVVGLLEERASELRRDPPAARRSQPAMGLEMRPRTSRAAIGVKAGAVIAALGVLCAGAWYVRAIRDDAHPHAGTQRVAERDALQPSPTVAPGAPDPASPDPASPDPASPDPASPDPASPDPTSPDPASPDRASIDDAAPQPSPTPALDSASGPPRPVTSPRQKRGSGDSEAEAKLVLTAGAALVRDDAETALALTRQHLAQFPNGAHAEERDRIEIEALARLGESDDARAAASRFFLRYPRSIYRSRIESLVR